MNKHKICFIVCTCLLLGLIIAALPSYSACSTRQKNMVCQRCEQRALSSSECMTTCSTCPSNSTTTCPSCPTTTCPTCSSGYRDLKNVYNFSVDIPNKKTHNYSLFIETHAATVFTYRVQYLNAAYIDALPRAGITNDGFLTFSIPVIENLPFEPKLVTLYCLVFIDSNGFIDNNKTNSCSGYYDTISENILIVPGILTSR